MKKRNQLVENTPENNSSHCFISVDHDDDKFGDHSDHFAVPNSITSSEIDEWVKDCYGQFYSWRSSTPEVREENEFHLLC